MRWGGRARRGCKRGRERDVAGRVCATRRCSRARLANSTPAHSQPRVYTPHVDLGAVHETALSRLLRPVLMTSGNCIHMDLWTTVNMHHPSPLHICRIAQPGPTQNAAGCSGCTSTTHDCLVLSLRIRLHVVLLLVECARRRVCHSCLCTMRLITQDKTISTKCPLTSEVRTAFSVDRQLKPPATPAKSVARTLLLANPLTFTTAFYAGRNVLRAFLSELRRIRSPEQTGLRLKYIPFSNPCTREPAGG